MHSHLAHKQGQIPQGGGVGGGARYVRDSLRVFHTKCISILITSAVTRRGNPPIQIQLVNTIDSPSVAVSSDFASHLWMADYIHLYSIGQLKKRLEHPWILVSMGGSDPGSGRSPGEGNGNPLQDSCLGNPMDRGAWQATVHGVAQTLTGLSD